MMTCRELLEHLDAYLANELDRETRLLVDEHLALCADCASYVDSYRKTIELSREALQAPPNGPPPELPESLVKAILAARRRSS